MAEIELASLRALYNKERAPVALSTPVAMLGEALDRVRAAAERHRFDADWIEGLENLRDAVKRCAKHGGRDAEESVPLLRCVEHGTLFPADARCWFEDGCTAPGREER